MKIADNHKPRTAQGLCIAIIAACIACVPQAEAITFDGNTSGIFVNPTGPSGMYATGVDTNYFQWGVGYYSPQSALYFSGTNFTGVSTDQYFDLGDLYYLNGTAWAGTQAYSVDLRTSLAFTAPSGITQDFDFNFGLINTLNTADPWASADSILLSANFPTTSFAVGGIDYTLTVGFGSATGSGYSEINEFYVLEDGSASAKLVGKITGKSVPDTGSTLALMAMAVVGVGGLRQYLTCKARLNCFR